MAGSLPPCPPHPPVGPIGATSNSTLTNILAVGGGIGTAVGIIGKFIDGTGVSTFPLTSLTAPGIGAIGLAGAAAAAAVVVIAFVYLYDRCISHPTGLEACSAGVIDNIVPAFSDTSSKLFPFTAQHDLVSVVTQCQFWPLIAQSAAFLYTNSTDNSPEIHCYYRNSAVCAAGVGSVVGAVAGGTAGIALGIIAGAALGCAGTGPGYFFCLLLACLIAAAIVAAAALLGALIGGYIAASGAIPHPTTDDGSQPSVGDYITTCGNTIIYGDDQGARVYWFVEHSALHGHSRAGAGQQWVHADPDGQTQLTTSCQSLCPKAFTGAPDPPPVLE